MKELKDGIGELKTLVNKQSGDIAAILQIVRGKELFDIQPKLEMSQADLEKNNNNSLNLLNDRWGMNDISLNGIRNVDPLNNNVNDSTGT